MSLQLTELSLKHANARLEEAEARLTERSVKHQRVLELEEELKKAKEERKSDPFYAGYLAAKEQVENAEVVLRSEVILEWEKEPRSGPKISEMVTGISVTSTIDITDRVAAMQFCLSFYEKYPDEDFGLLKIDLEKLLSVIFQMEKRPTFCDVGRNLSVRLKRGGK